MELPVVVPPSAAGAQRGQGAAELRPEDPRQAPRLPESHPHEAAHPEQCPPRPLPRRPIPREVVAPQIEPPPLHVLLLLLPPEHVLRRPEHHHGLRHARRRLHPIRSLRRLETDHRIEISRIRSAIRGRRGSALLSSSLASLWHKRKDTHLCLASLIESTDPIDELKVRHFFLLCFSLSLARLLFGLLLFYGWIGQSVVVPDLLYVLCFLLWMRSNGEEGERLVVDGDSFVKERYAAAAVFIQTAFRGYLARRALRALKGLVKRQALVRGHNVRKQANMTLRCMQALVRVQARDRDQRMRLAHESAAAASAISHGSNKSSFSCDTSLWDSKLVQDLAERRSMSREGSSFADDWDDRPRTVEEIEAMLQLRKEVALKRERELSYAFSHQDRWIASRSSFDNRVSSRAARTSTDKRDPIKTLEIDTARPFAYCSAPANNHRKCPPVPQHPRSPLHRAHHHSPVTPSPSKTRPLQVRSASPRCGREERSFYVTMETPSYYQHYQGGAPGQQRRAVAVPNYMAATESAKARVRSQSAPRQRHATPERDRGSAGSAAKKRLSFPAPAPYSQSLRSPSFKSAAGQFAGDYHSNVSSSCNDSVFGGEVSPAMAPVILRRGLR
ncbi:hypothetical protein ZIOFF_055458 [Zingiber officinale]|uniref:DUF4005 domain-containing protein n=1 Tax=Zingiber officinale TaxID=94328 RepID=A0A8J5FM64_ZINOF|nr:hypothetical protein ZIOFF_055458 [Zingiber officinale]